MSKIDAVLDHLTRARSTGPGSWLACCPAHDDHNPSMTLRETNDGRILIHCFAGCEVADILGVLGLKFDALFPEPLPEKIEYRAPLRRPVRAEDALAALAEEARIVSLVASDVVNGEPVTLIALERMRVARDRIVEARRLALGDA